MWVGACVWWDSTRHWVPVYMPVSLAAGQLRTPEFQINVASAYTVCVAVNWPSGNDSTPVRRMLGVEPFDSSPSVIGVSWRLSRGGQIVASGRSDGTTGAACGVYYGPSRNLGSFYAGTGRYVLDMDVERDGSALNQWAPYLVVLEDGGRRGELYARADWGMLLVLLAPVGVVMLVRAANGWRIEKQNAWKKAWPLTQPGPQVQISDEPRGAAQYIRSGTRFRLQRSNSPIPPVFMKPAWSGLVMLLCFVVIDIPVWVSFVAYRAVPMGLPVHLMKTAGSYPSSPGIQPVLVRLVLDGCDPHPLHYGDPRPCLYIDSQLVSWESFDSVLQKKLKLRPPHWPVYLEGDKAMDWRYAGEAIDRIRGLQAEVVLLGSRTP
jgi:hypothetical protein